ncbi:MAG: tRNA (adenine(22)-N(1))-methyltransferase [Bacillota bacterium]|jgi:tRNA (adenine22-N1)-methyltransferase
MQIELSHRLDKVAGMVIPGKITADIGADHAYLSVYLVINNICPKVIATDRVRGPLVSARQLVELLSLDKQIDIRLGEGLEVLTPGEAATICIAGMGGSTIRSILHASPDVLEKTQRLVLQPQRNIADLRYYLAETGWKIIAEEIVMDSGFYYQIMSVEKGHMVLTDEEAEFGPLLLARRHPLLTSYMELKLADYKSLIERLNAQEGVDVQARIEELMDEVASIEKLLANYG